MTNSIIKIILIAFLFINSIPALADVIFFPRQYSLLCYSAEFILNLETSVKPKATNVGWAGIGCVGSFYYFDQPTFGIELAYERRLYFKPDSYKHFFFSSYIGTAIMTNFNSINNIGVVPGFKINYKAHISKNLFLEPYLGLSIPIVFDLPDFSGYVPFPVLTIGTRFGLFEFKSKSNKS